MSVLYQAVNVKAPNYRSVTGSDSGATVAFSSQILYTMAAATKVNELPERFHGKFIRFTAIGADCSFVFSDVSTLVVDNTIAATDAGATSTNLGGQCLSGISREFRVPTAPVGGPTPLKLYFARQGSGTGSVLIELAED
jgi:hypothetical protein